MYDSYPSGKTWRVLGNDGFDGLVFDDTAPTPKIGTHECLVKIEAVSLNYRDLMVAQVCILRTQPAFSL